MDTQNRNIFSSIKSSHLCKQDLCKLLDDLIQLTNVVVLEEGDLPGEGSGEVVEGPKEEEEGTVSSCWGLEEQEDRDAERELRLKF